MFAASKNLALNIAKIIDDKKGKNIKILDIRDKSSFTDFFVLGNGSSVRQVKAIADEIEDQLKINGILLDHKEGYENGRWILLDYINVIVHLFLEEDRRFYDIDRVWKDAPSILFDTIAEKNYNIDKN